MAQLAIPMRIIIMILLLISLVCVIVGRRTCIKGFGCSPIHIRVSSWKATGSKLQGQYLVVIASAAYIVLFGITMVLRLMKKFMKGLELGVSGSAILIMLICAIMEAVYAAFGQMSPPGGGHVESWAAAAFFYFVVLGLSAADLCLNVLKGGNFNLRFETVPVCQGPPNHKCNLHRATWGATQFQCKCGIKWNIPAKNIVKTLPQI